MMKSEFLKLNLRDVVRGAIVAACAAVMAGVVPILESGQLPDIAYLKSIAVTGIAAGSAYLLKNLLTNSQDEIARRERK